MAGTAALCAAFLLGTLGWFVTAFGIASNCTDLHNCGSSSCAPCAAESAWVSAGGIGQWVVVGTAVAVLLLVLWRPDWRRRATAVAACVLMPLAVAWFALTIAIAQCSY